MLLYIHMHIHVNTYVDTHTLPDDLFKGQAGFNTTPRCSLNVSMCRCVYVCVPPDRKCQVIQKYCQGKIKLFPEVFGDFLGS